VDEGARSGCAGPICGAVCWCVHCKGCTRLRTGLVKRFLQAGLVPLQELWELVNARLAHTGAFALPAELAAFASDILCLDETRLDALGRESLALAQLEHTEPGLHSSQTDGPL
jgi:hypothetical protein